MTSPHHHDDGVDIDDLLLAPDAHLHDVTRSDADEVSEMSDRTMSTHRPRFGHPPSVRVRTLSHEGGGQSCTRSMHFIKYSCTYNALVHDVSDPTYQSLSHDFTTSSFDDVLPPPPPPPNQHVTVMTSHDDPMYTTVSRVDLDSSFDPLYSDVDSSQTTLKVPHP